MMQLHEDRMTTIRRRLPGRTIGSIVVLVAACLGGLALAQDSGAPTTIIPEYHKMARQAASPAQLLAILDADGNGQIDRAEWQIRKMAIFYMRDRNNDSQLRPNELPGLDHAQFTAADLNGDGTLSGYEFNQAAFSQFYRADDDGDGIVSKQEFEAYAATISASG